MLGVGPRLHLTDRHQSRLDQIIARRSIIAHRNNLLHPPANRNRIHTPNNRDGVSQGSPDLTSQVPTSLICSSLSAGSISAMGQTEV